MTMPQDVSRPQRKKMALIYLGICLLLLLLGLVLWLFFFRFRVYTDDAYVQGNQVYITPLRSGFVTAIHTDDTFLVNKGQLIVELDKTDSLIALDSAKSELAQAVRSVCQSFHQVFVYKEEIGVKRSELIKAIQDYEHREDVLPIEGVSVEDYEHAIAALRANYFSLEMTHTLYKQALAEVQGTSIKNHPVVLSAADKVREAFVQLHRCGIYSPVEGLAAQRTIQVGMWVDAGQPLLSVIPLDQIWVNANYKETQMKHVRLNQNVRITSDLYGRGVVFHGKIVGLPGAAGNAFSLLPPQNLSGNWIKIVQRVPVRIELDQEELKKYPLRIGLSMESVVELGSDKGALIPTSNEGSPTYSTPVYNYEEEGDLELIGSIIDANLDPTLIQYAEASLELPEIENEFKDQISDVLHERQ